MKQGFLEQESRQANKRNRKLFLILLFIYIGLLAIISFAVKDSIDLNDHKSKEILVYGILLLSQAGRL